MRMPFRKPLIVAAPKKLLKFKGAASDIEEFGPGTRFLPIITDQNPNAVAKNKIKKVILCSGQVYFDLEQRREKQGRNDVSIVRLESLCPFPFKELIKELKEYSKDAEIVWAQEEPKNAGGYIYADPRLRNIMEHVGLKQDGPTYAGRPIMAAAAVGYTSLHNQ
jgi:2-oxoglutarate dehydrogenase E1 component